MTSVGRRASLLGFALAITFLLPFYLTTLQTIPNGSDHYYMIDVGETQIVLNLWGTLHATGYPLYVIIGNLLVAILKFFGASSAAAPALVSLLWGIAALALIYTLAVYLTRRVILSAVVTVLFGLTRTVWIHSAIAEIYSFGLVILTLVLLLALWRGEIRHRVYWLAFIGGIGVAHHRALIMVAPALLYAVWPELSANRKNLPRILIMSILLGLLGLLQYVYLPLRANAGASWVYGEPETFSGLWDQFIGLEASRFIGPPASLVDNFNRVNNVLITDLTLPGLLIGLMGLVLALRTSRYSRAPMTLAISALVAYVFHVVFYGDVLSALILPVTLSVAFGWLFLADWLIVRSIRGVQKGVARYAPTNITFTWRSSFPILFLLAILVMLLGGGLAAENLPFIRALTTNQTGLETIRLARNAAPGDTLMISWGTRHFAVGFARDVLDELPGITLVDHKVDFAEILARGRLLTPDYTFFGLPQGWWEEELGEKIYLRAAAPHLVQIDRQPERAEMPLPNPVNRVEESATCAPDSIDLHVAWAVPETATQDLSVFVHLLDSGGNVIAQGDQVAPVYGLRPLTSWMPNELVRDVYPLPRLPDAKNIRYGLYRQLENGEFRNEAEFEVAVNCPPES
jgi:hypothetical protein